MQSLEELPAFLAYFCLVAVLVVAFLVIYVRITPMSEFTLINKSVPGAAISLGLSLFGFSLPVASAMAHAADIVDCAIWGVIALIVQLIVFFAARIPVPNMADRIAAGELAPAIWVGLASLTAGVLSAASMTL
jgi:putative membrane protein